MNKEELEEFLKIYKADLDYALDKCSERFFNLFIYNIIFEGMPELIKFAETVNKTLDTDLTHASGEYQKGYKDAFEDIKRLIYEKK
jgi:hypothetical protein